MCSKRYSHNLQFQSWWKAKSAPGRNFLEMSWTFRSLWPSPPQVRLYYCQKGEGNLIVRDNNNKRRHHNCQAIDPSRKPASGNQSLTHVGLRMIRVFVSTFDWKVTYRILEECDCHFAAVRVFLHISDCTSLWRSYCISSTSNIMDGIILLR